MDSSLSVMALTETWMKADDKALCAEIKDIGFSITSLPRKGRGGGVALVTRKCVKTRSFPLKFDSFECLEVLLMAPTSTRVVVIYRPGTTGRFSTFLDEFENLLIRLGEAKEPAIICGDFNIHMEDALNSQAEQFLSLLRDFNWINVVKGPTHTKGGTLDLILVQSSDPVDVSIPFCGNFSDVTRNPNPRGTIETTDIRSFPVPAAPDHYLVTCMLSLPVAKEETGTEVNVRDLQNVDRDMLREMVLQSDLCDDLPTTLEDCVDLYNETLRNILDETAPLETKTLKPKTQPRWMRTPECTRVRRLRRKAERRWYAVRRKSDDVHKLKLHYHNWKISSKVASKTLCRARISHYQQRLVALKGKPRETFQVINGLLDSGKGSSTLPSKDNLSLAVDFNNFFKEKVTKIYTDIEAEDLSPPSKSTAPEPPRQCSFNCFRPVSDEELLKTVKQMNSKQCPTDPMPTSMVKDTLLELLPSLSQIVNESLKSGIFPSQFKEAVIRPAFKGKGLDPESLGSYRPISNLCFVSKVVEKCVANQLVDYLENNELLASKQSAYRRYHSCETATLKIMNDILLITDRKSKVILVLLDLSAAFDTVQHKKLLMKLERNYGIGGSVLQWFKSYLESRSTSVQLQDQRSSSIEVDIGVPQGSILGPLLFIMYTKELQEIASLYGLGVHMFADDTQLYIEFDEESKDKIIEDIQKCFQHIRWWMKDNHLKLNAGKTEVLILNNKSDKIPNPAAIALDPDECAVEPSTSVRNLGIWFDSTSSMSAHVSKVIQSCYYQLTNLWRIRKRLTKELRVQLVHSLIHSRLDYGNAHLYGLKQRDLQRLQKVQNCATRFVFGSRGRSGVSKLRKQLHFLPIEQRIVFKICLLAFKCLRGLAPPYLAEQISFRKLKPRQLRLDADRTLLEKPFKTKYRSTESAFSVCAPKLWNSLPREIRETENLELFKTSLKTHLFGIAYS